MQGHGLVVQQRSGRIRRRQSGPYRPLLVGKRHWAVGDASAYQVCDIDNRSVCELGLCSRAGRAFSYEAQEQIRQGLCSTGLDSATEPCSLSQLSYNSASYAQRVGFGHCELQVPSGDSLQGAGLCWLVYWN